MIQSNKALKRFLNEKFNAHRGTIEPNEHTSPYFGQIGSTSYEDIPYDIQLEVKVQALKEIFTNVLSPEVLKAMQIFPSEKTYNYRFRMDYVCSYNPFESPNNKFGQRMKRRFNKVVDMHESVLLPKEVFIKARNVFDNITEAGIQPYDLVAHHGFLRYIVARAHEGNELFTIVTNGDDNQELIKKQAEYLIEQGVQSVFHLNNNTISDTSEGNVVNHFGKDHIVIPITVNDQSFSFKITHNSFFQNNIPAFERLIEWIFDVLGDELKQADIFDLFSGVGLLGIILGKQAKSITGFEINAADVALANENTNLNIIDHASYHVLDLYKETPTLDVDSRSIVIVDPPRTGLEKNGVELLLKIKPRKIIYISCNPITQAIDLKGHNGKPGLLSQYNVIHHAGFDLFPHTPHLEHVAILEKLKG